MTTEWDREATNGICPDYQGPAPCPIDPATGQHKSYWVLPEEERKKGFVRPVRRTYFHVGAPGPKYPTRELTDDENGRYSGVGYAKFEIYPESESPKTGRFWTQQELDRVGKGCQTSTTMGQAIAETYARNPNYYGATMCVYCKRHFPVGEEGEFTWEDGSKVGT